MKYLFDQLDLDNNSFTLHNQVIIIYFLNQEILSYVFAGNESYLSYNFSQSLSPIKNLTSPPLELSEEKASLTEVSSNANNTDDIPVNTDMPVDTRDSALKSKIVSHNVQTYITSIIQHFIFLQEIRKYQNIFFWS